MLLQIHKCKIFAGHTNTWKEFIASSNQFHPNLSQEEPKEQPRDKNKYIFRHETARYSKDKKKKTKAHHQMHCLVSLIHEI